MHTCFTSRTVFFLTPSLFVATASRATTNIVANQINHFRYRNHHINLNCLSFKCAYECLCVSGLLLFLLSALSSERCVVRFHTWLPKWLCGGNAFTLPMYCVLLNEDHEAIKFSANIVIKDIFTDIIYIAGDKFAPRSSHIHFRF